ncbi:MAG: 23S rRNA (adenine(2503)-C(2))-methyltransferase RlmN [Verrucomicrobia bacterium]|nr:23S rRNA (adenine(2503)-C(2))-methyltransferase RlmN [Verrucomicrobiota bacterium]
MQEKRSIYNLALPALKEFFAHCGEQPYRARQVMHWLYRKRVNSFGQMTDLSAKLRDLLESRFYLRSLRPERKTGAGDSTHKFLFGLSDNNYVESVLIPASPALYGNSSDRRTICISTQVGCAYGCKFCASGLDGWKRNLTAAEIVEQLLQVEALCSEKVNNIVFMGMGEPLANFENLLSAIKIINASWGLGIGARHITVSTSGLVPRIRDLADNPIQIRLAISLHGATDAIRTEIMPINRRFNIMSLMEACAYYRAKKHQKITFEYILIDEFNDRLSEAVELAKLAKSIDAKVNLIPYNTVEGLPWRRSSEVKQNRFLAYLHKQNVDATIRREKGHAIDAACGQLRLQTMQNKSFAAAHNLR